MQSIITKYLGATNYKPGRVKARQSGGPATVTLSYDHALDADDNHKAAAGALALKLGWSGAFIEGSLSNSENVYVFATGDALTVRA